MAHGSEPVELSKRHYEDRDDNNAIVIMHINWGRKWSCGEYENAQIHKLSFQKLLSNGEPSDEPAFEIETPSRLFVNDAFTQYTYLLESAKYAIVGYDIKVARSSTDVGHLVAKEDDLLDGGEALGGTFTAREDKVTYIGHFGVDCYQQPMPWRYHISGSDAFKAYVEDFRELYPFVKDIPVSFNLFSTETMGLTYTLDSNDF